MPIFYFDIHQVDGVVTDDTVGTDMADIAQARSEARRTFAEMTRDILLSAEKISQLKVTVRDAGGTVVHVQSASFSGDEDQ